MRLYMRLMLRDPHNLLKKNDLKVITQRLWYTSRDTASRCKGLKRHQNIDYEVIICLYPFKHEKHEFSKTDK